MTPLLHRDYDKKVIMLHLTTSRFQGTRKDREVALKLDIKTDGLSHIKTRIPYLHRNRLDDFEKAGNNVKLHGLKPLGIKYHVAQAGIKVQVVQTSITNKHKPTLQIECNSAVALHHINVLIYIRV